MTVLPDAPTRPSPIGLRLVAAVIDYTVGLLAFPVLWLVDRFVHLDRTSGTIAFYALFYGYSLVAHAQYHRTLGKFLCSLRIQRTDGRAIGWWRSAARTAVVATPAAVSGIVPSPIDGLLLIVPFVPILFDATRRGLHDRIAGTEVVCIIPKADFDPEAAIAQVLRSRMRDDRNT